MADDPSERTATADTGASEHVERFLDLIEHDRPEAAIDLGQLIAAAKDTQTRPRHPF